MDGSRYRNGMIMNATGGIGNIVPINSMNSTTNALVNQYKSFYGKGFYDNWFSFMTRRLARVNSNWDQEHSSFAEFRDNPRKVTFSDTVVCYNYDVSVDIVTDCTESESEEATIQVNNGAENSLDNLDKTFSVYEVGDGFSDNTIRFFDVSPMTSEGETPVQTKKEVSNRSPRKRTSVRRSQSLDSILPSATNINEDTQEQQNSQENNQSVEKSVSDTSVVDGKQYSRKTRVCTPRFVDKSKKSSLLINGESLLQDSPSFSYGAGDEERRGIITRSSSKKSEDETDEQCGNDEIVAGGGDCVPVHTSVTKMDLFPIQSNFTTEKQYGTSISSKTIVEPPRLDLVNATNFNAVLPTLKCINADDDAPKKVVRAATPRFVKNPQETTPAVVVENPKIDLGQESPHLEPKKESTTFSVIEVTNTNSLKSVSPLHRKESIKKETRPKKVNTNKQKEGQRLFNEIKAQIANDEVNNKVLTKIFNKRFLALLANDFTNHGDPPMSPSPAVSKDTLRQSEKCPPAGVTKTSPTVSKWATRPVVQKKTLINKSPSDTPAKKVEVNRGSIMSTPRKSPIEVKENGKVKSTKKSAVKKKSSKTEDVVKKPIRSASKTPPKIEKNVCINDATFIIDSKKREELVVKIPEPKKTINSTKIPRPISAKSPEIKKELPLPKAKPIPKINKSSETPRKIVHEREKSPRRLLAEQKKEKGVDKGDSSKNMKMSVGLSIPSKHPLEYSSFDRWLTESRKYGVNGGLSSKKPVSSSQMSVGDERELKIIRNIKRNPQLLDAYTTYKYGGPLTPSEVNEVMRKMM